MKWLYSPQNKSENLDYQAKPPNWHKLLCRMGIHRKDYILGQNLTHKCPTCHKAV